jgi:hypothetical protein
VPAGEAAYDSNGPTARCLTTSHAESEQVDAKWRPIPTIERLLVVHREQMQHQRQVVMDLLALTMGQTVRFYSAVAAPSIRTEDRLERVC